MSVATLSESRVFERGLEYSRDFVIREMKEQAFDCNPLSSILCGKLNTKMFGAQQMMSKGKEVITGGTTIEGRVNLGKNTSVKKLAGHWDTNDTTPSDTPRHWRASWKEYTATVNVNKFELNANKNPDAIANLVQNETVIAMGSLVDALGSDFYDNGGDGNAVTSLSTLVGANNSVQGLDGGTYTRWNSRGVSARNTAPASIVFAPTTTSFASAGISNMRTAWLNCQEGMLKPDVLLTTHAIYSYYEATLQPLERFGDTRVADGGFQQLLYKTAPIFPDPQCTSGTMWFLNFDHLGLKVMAGGDFAADEFVKDPDSNAYISTIYVCAQLAVSNRFLQNKLTGITA